MERIEKLLADGAEGAPVLGFNLKMSSLNTHAGKELLDRQRFHQRLTGPSAAAEALAEVRQMISTLTQEPKPSGGPR